MYIVEALGKYTMNTRLHHDEDMHISPFFLMSRMSEAHHDQVKSTRSDSSETPQAHDLHKSTSSHARAA
jgi:hypothetical protein